LADRKRRLSDLALGSNASCSRLDPGRSKDVSLFSLRADPKLEAKTWCAFWQTYATVASVATPTTLVEAEKDRRSE